MRSMIFTSALMIGSCFVTVAENPYQEHNKHEHKRTDFEYVIDNYKDSALESKFRAYKLIELIATGEGKVGNYSFNGIGSLGTYEEHKLAFELLQYIGNKYGSGFYIPYGDNYDFVRTAINYGALFGKGVESKATNSIISNNKNSCYNDEDTRYSNDTAHLKSHTAIKKAFEKAINIDNKGQLANESLVDSIIDENPDILNDEPICTKVKYALIKGAIKSFSLVHNIISKKPDILFDPRLRDHITGYLEEANYVSETFIEHLCFQNPEILQQLTKEGLAEIIIQDSLKLDKKGRFKREWLVREIIEQNPHILISLSNIVDIFVNSICLDGEENLRSEWMISQIIKCKPDILDLLSKEDVERIFDILTNTKQNGDLHSKLALDFAYYILHHKFDFLSKEALRNAFVVSTGINKKNDGLNSENLAFLIFKKYPEILSRFDEVELIDMLSNAIEQTKLCNSSISTDFSNINEPEKICKNLKGDNPIQNDEQNKIHSLWLLSEIIKYNPDLLEKLSKQQTKLILNLSLEGYKNENVNYAWIAYYLVLKNHSNIDESELKKMLIFSTKLNKKNDFYSEALAVAIVLKDNSILDKITKNQFETIFQNAIGFNEKNIMRSQILVIKIIENDPKVLDLLSEIFILQCFKDAMNVNEDGVPKFKWLAEKLIRHKKNEKYVIADAVLKKYLASNNQHIKEIVKLRESNRN
jgi:hypothetical protein